MTNNGCGRGERQKGRLINRFQYIKDLNFNFFQISCHLNALLRPRDFSGGVGLVDWRGGGPRTPLLWLAGK